MKKIISLSIGILIIATTLGGCGSKNKDNAELLKYKNSMTEVFEAFEKIDSDINSIDPNDADSISQLFEQFDSLENEFKIMADINVPADFSYNESLADEAYDYMVQANEYLKQSFSDSSYNQYTLDAAMECYKRANKRVQYIISILHGELPSDENVSYS